MYTGNQISNPPAYPNIAPNNNTTVEKPPNYNDFIIQNPTISVANDSNTQQLPVLPAPVQAVPNSSNN